MLKKINICGLEFSNAELGAMVEEAITLLEKEGKHTVFPANVESIMLSDEDSFLKKIYNEASLLLADGMPVVWASRILNTPVIEKVSGPDFLPLLLRRVTFLGKSVFILGGENGVAETAGQKLSTIIGNFKFAGCMHGFFKKKGSENEKVIKRINSSGASVLIVAFGTPLQEKWIYENLPSLNVKLAIGVGAAVDFISGKKKRAPRWMSEAGIEWMHRLSREPSRLWKRYLLRDVRFPFLVLKSIIK